MWAYTCHSMLVEGGGQFEVLSFHHVGLGDRTQTLRCGSKYPYPVCHPTGPLFIYLFWCMHVCVPVCAGVEARGWFPGSLSFSTLLFEIDPMWGSSRFNELASLVGQPDPEICLFVSLRAGFTSACHHTQRTWVWGRGDLYFIPHSPSHLLGLMIIFKAEINAFHILYFAGFWLTIF